MTIIVPLFSSALLNNHAGKADVFYCEDIPAVTDSFLTGAVTVSETVSDCNEK